jgi:hypothetical protein
MRKIRLFSKSAASETGSTEAMMMEAIEKWQREHPKCTIVGHSMASQSSPPRLYISVEYDDPGDETAGA